MIFRCFENSEHIFVKIVCKYFEFFGGFLSTDRPKRGVYIVVRSV